MCCAVAAQLLLVRVYVVILSLESSLCQKVSSCRVFLFSFLESWRLNACMRSKLALNSMRSPVLDSLGYNGELGSLPDL